MKKIAKNGTIVLSLALIIAGCSGKKSLQEAKSDFNKTISALSSYGIDAKSQKDKFVVEIKNSKLLSKRILSNLNIYDIDGRYTNFLSSLIASKKFGVDVDWNKYREHKAKSVYVYYLGDDKTSAHIKELISKKAIGAYLTFNKDDKLTNIDFKDINDKYTTKNGIQNTLQLTGANIVITPQEGEKQKYTLNSGKLTISDNKGNNLNFSGLKCDVDKDNAYLGSIKCQAPKMTGLFKNKRGNNSKLTIENISIDSIAKAKSGKVNQDVKFLISNLLVSNDNRQKTDIVLKNIKLNMQSLASEDAYKKIYESYKNISSKKEDMAKNLKIVFKTSANMMKDAEVKYDLGIDEFNVNNTKGNYKAIFKLSKYSQNGNWNFKDKFGYGDTIKIDNINMNMMGKEIFNLKGLEYTTSLSNMYNFWPDYMTKIGDVMSKSANGKQPSPQEINKIFSEIGPKVVNNGFSYSIKPLKFDNLLVPDRKSGGNIELSKLLINLDANLAKNDIKLDNPQVAKMMLLKYLTANSHIELSKKDFETITAKSPQMMMLVMFAKFKGDKAIFDLEFKDGHLKVNGKPVM